MSIQTADLLTQEIAQEICDILHEETGHPVIMANREGMIFAATVKSRIGTFHAVAKKVMDGELKEGVVTLEEEKALNGTVKAGINIPVSYKGVRVVNMGIAGDPTIVRPIVGIASRIMQIWLKNLELLAYLSESIENVNASLEEIAATVQEITEGSKQVAEASQITVQIANESREKVKNIEQVLGTIKQIASQSNMIGLNAAIEAARVGEAGRGFSVVANEVRKLSTSSTESVESIGAIITEIQSVFHTISEKIEENTRVIQTQSASLTSASAQIQHIEETMSKIVEKVRE